MADIADINEDIFQNDYAESPSYLSQQIITYIGNKRNLLSLIDEGIGFALKKLDKKKLKILDGFSGSGVVSRNLKRYANLLYTNDLELYSYIINKCYLSNTTDINEEFISKTIDFLNQEKLRNDYGKGIIEKLYAPKNDQDIKFGERVFYTNKNAKIIDNIRRMLNKESIPNSHLFLAPLLFKASVNANTSGVFKGFYKNTVTGLGQFGGDAQNCLTRIKNEIGLSIPIFSWNECETIISQKDIIQLVEELDDLDIAYYDPPYNQHPYGSNYFMLNIIAGYKEPKNISKISGIPNDWNKSLYNTSQAYEGMENLIDKTKAKIILISYNNEGIIPVNVMEDLLSGFGKLTTLEKKYPAFKGSRNLNNRELTVKELLYILEKR